MSIFLIDVPPLRKRPEDIPLLTDYFEGVLCFQLSRTALNLSDEPREPLLRHSWPGNVAELRKLVRLAFNASNEKALKAFVLNELEVSSSNISAQDGKGPGGQSYRSGRKCQVTTLSLKEACKTIIEKTEKEIISEALGRTNWNRRRAAEILDISYRTLLNKIKGYELHRVSD